jgi:formyl-CoA transferase
MFAPISHKTRGDMVMPGWPVKMSASNVKITAAPILGEHTEQVLKEWLQMSDADVAAYQSKNPIKA